MLDAYTVRKAIPRLVIAVIAINLSIYLCVAALDIATIVGKGMNQLLVAPFVNSNSFDGIKIEGNFENNIIGVLGFGVLAGSVFALLSGGLGASAVAILGLLLPLIVTAALMTLAILFTLVVWQALVIFLTVISPVAFACYVLPGTEKYFRQWWDLYLRTLVVFPLIAIFFAMSNVMASILLNAATVSGDGIAAVQIFATIVVVFAPLVLIPFAFKMAGGLISQVGQFAGGQASGLSRRAGQAIRQNRQDPTSWLGKGKVRARDRRAERGMTTGQVFSGLRGAAGGVVSGAGVRGGYRAGSRAVHTDHSKHRMEEIAKHEAVQPVANNDDFLEAARQNRTEAGVRNHLANITDANGNHIYQGRALDDATASIMRAKSVASHEEFEKFAAVQIASTGTGYGSGSGEMLQAINEAYGDDRVGAANALAQARDLASRSRRPDLAGGGFGDQLGQMEQLNSGAITQQEATQHLDRQTLRSQGGGVIVSARPSAIRRLAPTMVNDLQEVVDGIHAGTHTQRDLDQSLAALAGRYDAMQQVSPENAEEMANGVLGQSVLDPVTGQQVNILQAIEARRGNQAFLQMRREYGQTAVLAHQQAQAQQAAQNPGVNLPQNNQPGNP